MAVLIGLNFRANSGFVPDGLNETHVLDTDAYPVTRGGVTFGWTSGLPGGNSRDRDASVDRRVAGIHFASNSASSEVFRLDLDNATTHRVRVAAGDTGFNNVQDVELGDDTSFTTMIDNLATAADVYVEADGTATALAVWPDASKVIEKVFTTTIFNVRLAGLSASSLVTTLAHLFVEEPVADDPCSEAFPKDTFITLTPTPDSGSEFVGWSDDIVSAANPLGFAITADTNLTATFNLEELAFQACDPVPASPGLAACAATPASPGLGACSAVPASPGLGACPAIPGP